MKNRNQISSRVIRNTHTAVIANASHFDSLGINPRYGKKSFFFGGEFEIPTANNQKALPIKELAAACCDFAIQGDINDTHWWVVYKHSTGSYGNYVLSINQVYRGHRSEVQAGIIMIRHSDVTGMSNGLIAKMLDNELAEYSKWLNVPLS
ncbi:MAG: hypothetical protein J6N72_10395, partial [Psychrobacter sp.]|nr:hypothetical protein [Psychrobacter sp.]